jgi:hypothetical protein
VTFHPWIFYVPGLLYAEHGHQYHDINVVDTILRPTPPGRPDRLALPLASHLIEGPARFTVHAARRALNSRGLARARAAYRQDVLSRDAGGIALDAPTLVALDRLSETSAGAILRRLATRALRRPPRGATQRDGYLHRGARSIDQVLRAAGAHVPYLVFGHTHVAERFPIDPTATTLYVNCGTWSPFVPRGLPVDERRFTFARVCATSGAGVWRWDDRAGRPLELSPRQPRS